MTAAKTTAKPAAKGAATEKAGPAPAPAPAPTLTTAPAGAPAAVKETAKPAAAPARVGAPAGAPAAAKETAKPAAKPAAKPTAKAAATPADLAAAIFPTGEGPDLFAGYAQIAEAGTENVRAVIAAGTVLAKGLEVLGQEVATYTRDSLTAGVAAARQLAECETLEQALDHQSAFAKTSFDRFVAETARLSDISATLAKDSLQPLSTRVGAAADGFTKSRAA